MDIPLKTYRHVGGFGKWDQKVLAFAKLKPDNASVDMARKNQKLRIVTKREVHEAAVILGTSSWQALSERFTPEQLSVRLSVAGKLGGRPRKMPRMARRELL
jgi:hypothetical protein